MDIFNVEIENINTWDYPDFSDAFISYVERVPTMVMYFEYLKEHQNINIRMNIK